MNNCRGCFRCEPSSSRDKTACTVSIHKVKFDAWYLLLAVTDGHWTDFLNTFFFCDCRPAQHRCYADYGCFSDEVPFSHLPLPWSLEDINITFHLIVQRPLSSPEVQILWEDPSVSVQFLFLTHLLNACKVARFPLYAQYLCNWICLPLISSVPVRNELPSTKNCPNKTHSGTKMTNVTRGSSKETAAVGSHELNFCSKFGTIFVH